jgi:hypothetical protein
MLHTIQRFAQFLNQYANLLLVFANTFLVLLTAVYVWLTSRTLTALQQASLREREAHHLQQIKDHVIQPIIFWISRTLFERFTGQTPELLVISGGYDGKPRQFSHTVDNPFTARRRLSIPSDPDVPDELTVWSGTESDRISQFLYNETKQAHFQRELAEFDRLLDDVRQLTSALISFANESAKDISDPKIPQALCPADENSMPEWTNPYLLAADCIHSILLGKKDTDIELGAFSGFYVLATARNQSVAKTMHPDTLKHWCEQGREHVRKRWQASDLPDRVRNLLENADSVRRNIEQFLFTQSLGVDCELVSGRKRRKIWGRTRALLRKSVLQRRIGE